MNGYEVINLDALAAQSGASSQAEDATLASRGRAIRDVLVDLNNKSRADEGAGGKVELSLAAFGSVLEALTATDGKPVPSTAAVASLVVSGDIDLDPSKDSVELEMVFSVHVLRDDWITVPLVGEGIAVRNVCITMANSDGIKNDKAIAYLDLLQQNGKCAGYGLAAKGICQWEIKVELLVPFCDDHRRSFVVKLPVRPICTRIKSLNAPNSIDIRILSSLETQTSSANDDKQQVNGVLPPTGQISVTWTDREVDDADADETVEQQAVTFSSDTTYIYSIGDGLVRCRVSYTIRVLHGARLIFEFEVPKQYKVLDVSGSGLKKWEILSLSSDTSVGAEAQRGGQSVSSSGTSKVLRVTHARGATDIFGLTISLESYLVEAKEELAPEAPSRNEILLVSGFAHMPSLRLLDSLRETGYVAVEAETSIEVIEKSKSVLSRVDEEELPQLSTRRTEYPLVYCYKFLSSGWFLSCSVTKHEDVDVLICLVEEAWVRMTLTQDGRIMTKMELKVKNTSKQFLRIELPEDSSVWSTEVRDQMRKPAAEGGCLLVPLEKNQRTDFWVEVVFLHTVEKMNGHGTIDLSVSCSFDTPVNQLFLSVFLPERFRYGEFTGDLPETKQFSKMQARKPAVKHHPFDQPNPEPAGQIQAAGEAFGQGRGRGEVTFGSLGAPAEVFKSKKSTKGIIPVKVSPVTEGLEFKFEKLFVAQGETFKLSVPYCEDEVRFERKRG